jgi:TetR/AcrR family transcriptional regulator
MTTENIQTEELIKETAKRLFFQKGHIHATTQEIANEAGVNRALIHYYFRSRDLLFEKVLDETIGAMHKKMDSIFLTKDSLRVKINRFIDAFIDQNIDYPYLENFLITEMAKSPEKIKQLPNQEKKEEFKKLIEKQLSDEIAAGTMAPIKLEHFIVNLMTMCNYPLVAKPLIQNAFGFDEPTYKNFLLERKRVVYRTIFNEDLPE